MTNTHKAHPAVSETHKQEPVANGYVFVAISILEKLGINKAVIDTIATTPPQRKPLTYQKIRDLWARTNGLEDCDLCKIDDFIAAVRFVEAAHGIKE